MYEYIFLWGMNNLASETVNSPPCIEPIVKDNALAMVMFVYIAFYMRKHL